MIRPLGVERGESFTFYLRDGALRDGPGHPGIDLDDVRVDRPGHTCFGVGDPLPFFGTPTFDEKLVI